MPLAVTLLGSAFNTTGGTKTVTATPAVGDLIVIITAHTAPGSTPTPTDNNSSGTYVRIAGPAFSNFTSELDVYVRTALIGSSSSTIFTHAPSSSTGGGLAVLKITGAGGAGSSVLRQSASESAMFVATPAPVLSTAALSSSAMIGAVLTEINPTGVTERSIYTELLDTGYNTPATGLEVMSLDSGETGTVISWGSSIAGTYGDIVIELYGPTEILADLFVNDNIFYAATVTATYGLTAPLFTNSTTFYAATISSSRAITAPHFVNTNTFYAATVSGAGALSPGLFVNTNTFYAATITRGAVNLAPALFANTNTFYAASIGTVTNLSAPLLVNENTFYPASFRGWIVRSDDATIWTTQTNDATTWTTETNDTTSWTA